MQHRQTSSLIHRLVQTSPISVHVEVRFGQMPPGPPPGSPSGIMAQRQLSFDPFTGGFPAALPVVRKQEPRRWLSPPRAVTPVHLQYFQQHDPAEAKVSMTGLRSSQIKQMRSQLQASFCLFSCLGISGLLMPLVWYFEGQPDFLWFLRPSPPPPPWPPASPPFPSAPPPFPSEPPLPPLLPGHHLPPPPPPPPPQPPPLPPPEKPMPASVRASQNEGSVKTSVNGFLQKKSREFTACSSTQGEAGDGFISVFAPYPHSINDSLISN